MSEQHLEAVIAARRRRDTAEAEAAAALQAFRQSIADAKRADVPTRDLVVASGLCRQRVNKAARQ
jgi:hypothetical protein